MQVSVYPLLDDRIDEEDDIEECTTDMTTSKENTDSLFSSFNLASFTTPSTHSEIYCDTRNL